MHRFYHHHHASCAGRGIRGKILLVGVTLWLTSTIIAGVRRSTGRTHNAHPPPPASLQHSSSKEDQEMQAQVAEKLDATREAAEAQLSPLESEYIDSARDAYTREQRFRWVEARRLQFDRHWSSLRGSLNGDPTHQHPYHHHGGFVRWYLGVGERTFDWMARKFAASHRFHWDDPRTTYPELSARSDWPMPYHNHHSWHYNAFQYPHHDNAYQQRHRAPPPPLSHESQDAGNPSATPASN
ncbi:hypothetical protein EV175_005912 [Coemansia sp. RSA 1933]|nr:hypothetical protein EV175_005912 [Coemansia sp. RSA 1933]